jgi:frataxin-like iron-binding protein CyaY
VREQFVVKRQGVRPHVGDIEPEPLASYQNIAKCWRHDNQYSVLAQRIVSKLEETKSGTNIAMLDDVSRQDVVEAFPLRPEKAKHIVLKDGMALRTAWLSSFFGGFHTNVP